MFKMTFKITPNVTFYLPFFTGHLVHGLFMNLVNSIDSNISKKFHEPNQVRPFATTPLTYASDEKLKHKVCERGMWKIERYRKYSFSISILLENELERRLFFEIPQYVTQNNIHLGIGEFITQGILINKKTFKSLIEDAIKLQNRLLLEFKTPTQFTKRGSNRPYLFPTPEYLLSNLARIWNTFSEIKVDLDELILWVKAHVFVRAYKLKTQEVNIGKTALQVGFRGNLLLIIDEGDFCEWVKALLLFSEYSNVGTKRSIGMGVVRVREKENLSKNATKSLV